MTDTTSVGLFGLEESKEATPNKKRASKKLVPTDGLPANLAQPVPVTVPDFSDPKRPKTCLEVDFPIVPINALSNLEGNAGKPIYQMSKWWARRRSCVFRSLLLAAAIEAPTLKNPDGSVMRDAEGLPIPDETEAARTVWDAYYANHQKAGNFKNLKVLDCFMGGGTTLVEGSRLGFQVAGVDLNPVAWLIVRNELACPDPAEVKKLFDQVDAEVKPAIQPFYVTDCPRGHKGQWFDKETSQPVQIDPLTLSPEERKKYRYEGPEVIYTFWAKHGVCVKPGCNHRTPIFRSPVVAEKVIGVKYLGLTCKACKTKFHAELGSARMAPGAERVILPSEPPFTELSQPFAQRLLEYNEGKKGDKSLRVHELSDVVDQEPGLKCPKCGAFAGQHVRDVLAMHRRATRNADIDKKHFPIEPPRQSVKPVYCYLLMDPEWLAGSAGTEGDEELGGFIDAPVDATAKWADQRLKNLRLIEVRGRIKLSEDTTAAAAEPVKPVETEVEEEAEAETDDGGAEAVSERKEYGLPRVITLANGRQIDTRKGTVPKKAAFTCGDCGKQSDSLDAVKSYTERQKAQRSAPVTIYTLQGFCPHCQREARPYDGRFFSVPSATDVARLTAAENEWATRREADLKDWWPRSALPYTWMTHHLNGGIPNWGFTHFWKMFNSRQLLVHAQLLRAIEVSSASVQVRDFLLGFFQQYLRNQNMFCFWNPQRDTPEPFFSNPHYHPKQLVIENSVFGLLGRGNWQTCQESADEALEWVGTPWEKATADNDGSTKSVTVETGDPVLPASATVQARSSTELDPEWEKNFDIAGTDPPFGDNLFYGDLANFFYVWLRLALKDRYPQEFGPDYVPRSQEAVADRSRYPDDDGTEEGQLNRANQFYQDIMTQCWSEARRVLKDGGLLAFTFHHSADAPWISVLRSLFDAGFLLEATYPIRSDETKGEGGQFGSRKIEYDIIHVCRKRLEEPKKVSWPKMRQWVKGELIRLRRLLESYKARELTEADIRVILRGKALEFYSRHYGQVYTSEDTLLSIRDALLGINHLLDEDTGGGGERPPSIVVGAGYEYLRLFGQKSALTRDEVSKSLRGTIVSQRELEALGLVREENKIVSAIPIRERFESFRKRPRKEMKSEIDQAHFLIGAALPSSGVSIEDELTRGTWMVRRSVEAVLRWYEKTAITPDVKAAAALAATLLKTTLEQNRAKLVHEQGFLFDDDAEDAA